MSAEWATLEEEIVGCRLCPRLVEHRERMARDKRAAYRDQEYWGRPVCGFGDRRARLVLVGLAPGAHGSNRTGRMFTGDRSGDWLYRALFETGFSSQPDARHQNDGLTLHDAFITAANRCAPPGNKPTPTEREECRPFLEREFDLIDSEGPGIRAIVALGQFAYDHSMRLLRDRGAAVPRPKPQFGHGRRFTAGAGGVAGVFPRCDVELIASYHPSQQNTFTGKLTLEMLVAVFQAARRALEG
ncbi:MAG TPA: uracil-DNA glycosylase [Acidobacteriota bacterium]|nr:uracil-DNA glycosylase [Acidobacteriota bacterium]